MKIILTISIAALFASSPALAATPPVDAEASIPFVDHGSISDWQPDGDQALYLRATGSQWYHAQLMGPCLDLDFSEAIGVESGGTNTLDRFSTLVVRGQRCGLKSLVKSGPPPKKK